jgi:hypothetical protein
MKSYIDQFECEGRGGEMRRAAGGGCRDPHITGRSDSLKASDANEDI